ncbi:hypothetical protein K1719_010933 [Acacia pycnantha]|nr:hypothetical protein K1719_010933 [Acacia pycnantha]
MGGIGKSTIAKTIFFKYSSHYEGSCFLENVRERSKNGLDELRHKFLSYVVKEDLCLDTSTTLLGSRLGRMKVFVVLDDVSTMNQLEYLVGEPHCFGRGSKILITTRDKHVLSKGVDEMVVVYAKGVPLALKVLGSHLRGRSEVEWESALRKLEKSPHEDIQKVLRLSYDGLNHEEKRIFLDVACFLKGELTEFVINLLDSFGFHGAIGIRILHDKALINVDNENYYDVLDNNLGSSKVEGIKLDVSEIRDIHLEADVFKKMPNLRYLNFYSNFTRGSSHVHLPKGLKFLPNKMRYLEWCGFPYKSLSSTFCAEKLVKLYMPYSHLQKLWNEVQDLKSLQEIDLSGSTHLQELLDLSKCMNLKVVHLRHCNNLGYVHSSILFLHSLESQGVLTVIKQTEMLELI